MKNKLITKIGAVTLASAMAFSLVPYAAFADDTKVTGAPGETNSNAQKNNRAITNDIADSDTIDVNKKGSINIYKYDTTSAEAAGKYHEGDIKATGQEDTNVAAALSDFKIKGVEFTYLKVGNIETYSETNTTTPGSNVVVVYEIPEALQVILNDEAHGHKYLPSDEASPVEDATKNGPFNMTKEIGDQSVIATPCTKEGVYHYTSTQISDALAHILEDDNITAKNALESYLVNYNHQSQDGDDTVVNDAAVTGATTGKGETDANGEVHFKNLPLGLYLIVETKVPEEVTTTVNPWFISLPFTNTSIQEGEVSHASIDGNNVSHSVQSSIDKEHPEASSSDNENNVNPYTDHTDNGVASSDNNGGDYWLYNFYAYPKNQTGNPTLDKSVRNAYSNKSAQKNDNVSSATSYDSALAGKIGAEGIGSGNTSMLNTANANTEKNYVVYNKEDGKHSADTNDAAYVLNRGGYTKGDDYNKSGSNIEDSAKYSKDFEYRDVTTASEGDVLDYIIVSKLPHISSKATYLSTYTFTDVLGRGITYNNDPRIAFYDNAEDAKANNTKDAVLVWEFNGDGTGNGNFGKHFADLQIEETDKYQTKMTIRMTENGLNQINREVESTQHTADYNASHVDADTKEYGLSDYYMVLYYTATVESNEQVTLGDEGNANDVSLLWSRTNNHKTSDNNEPENPNNPNKDYYNSLQDRNYVYSYGIDLTKTFSKNDGDFSKVQFKLYNDTDAYYIKATEVKQGDPAKGTGVYYVTGKTTSKSEATTLTPGSDGKLYIKGIEADRYHLSEVQTDDGYTLLKDEIIVDIVSTDRDIKASVAGTVGLTPANAKAIIDNYGVDYYVENGTVKKVEGSVPTEIKNEDDQQVDSATTDVGNKAVPGPKSEIANGRTIGKTDMYVGDIKPATATVDDKPCKLKASSTGDTQSANAEAVMSVLNQKNWVLPQTGGAGLYLITILGVLALAAGVALNKKKKTVE